MTLHLESPAEAIAAIATVVIAADNVTTFSERKFLFKQVQDLNPFEGYSQDEFRDLLVSISDRICDVLPRDGVGFTRDGIDHLCAAAKDILSPELQEAAFKMAVALAGADEIVAAEKELLDTLQQNLDIDGEVAAAAYKR